MKLVPITYYCSSRRQYCLVAKSRRPQASYNNTNGCVRGFDFGSEKSASSVNERLCTPRSAAPFNTTSKHDRGRSFDAGRVESSTFYFGVKLDAISWLYPHLTCLVRLQVFCSFSHADHHTHPHGHHLCCLANWPSVLHTVVRCQSVGGKLLVAHVKLIQYSWRAIFYLEPQFGINLIGIHLLNNDYPNMNSQTIAKGGADSWWADQGSMLYRRI